jgi:hypothetical protein
VARKGFRGRALLIPFGVVAAFGVTTFGRSAGKSVLTPARRSFFTAARKGDVENRAASLRR